MTSGGATTMNQARVQLRSVRESDLPDYVRWFNDPEVTQFTAMESGNITLEGEREWFAGISDPDTPGRTWAIEAGGRHVGNCALRPRGEPNQENASLGIAIGDKTAWGQGYGTAATREALRIGFDEMGLHRIELTAFGPNARAIRCYEKCGFQYVSSHYEEAGSDGSLAFLKDDAYRDIRQFFKKKNGRNVVLFYDMKIKREDLKPQGG
jgi:RimJ/RimL family protein N-acetyltransferase